MKSLKLAVLIGLTGSFLGQTAQAQSQITTVEMTKVLQSLTQRQGIRAHITVDAAPIGSGADSYSYSRSAAQSLKDQSLDSSKQGDLERLAVVLAMPKNACAARIFQSLASILETRNAEYVKLAETSLAKNQGQSAEVTLKDFQTIELRLELSLRSGDFELVNRGCIPGSTSSNIGKVGSTCSPVDSNFNFFSYVYEQPVRNVSAAAMSDVRTVRGQPFKIYSMMEYSNIGDSGLSKPRGSQWGSSRRDNLDGIFREEHAAAVAAASGLKSSDKEAACEITPGLVAYLLNQRAQDIKKL